MSRISEVIRQFIVANFLFGEEDARLTETVSLLKSGFVDSTGFLEIVLFIEENYRFNVEDDELIPENFDSIFNLSRFVLMKLGKITN